MKSFREFYNANNAIKEDLTIEDSDGNTFAQVIDLIKPQPLKVGAKCPSCGMQPCACVNEAKRLRIPSQTGNIVHVYLSWRGKNYTIQMFFPQVKTPSRRDVQDQMQKVYPGAKLWNYQVSDHDPGEPLLQVGGAR